MNSIDQVPKCGTCIPGGTLRDLRGYTTSLCQQLTFAVSHIAAR